MHISCVCSSTQSRARCHCAVAASPDKPKTALSIARLCSGRQGVQQTLTCADEIESSVDVARVFTRRPQAFGSAPTQAEMQLSAATVRPSRTHPLGFASAWSTGISARDVRAPRRRAVSCCHELQRSALDAIPQAAKLNAVAESLARSREVNSALELTRELTQSGEPIETRTVSAIVDAVVASGGSNAGTSMADLLSAAEPRGYGRELNTYSPTAAISAATDTTQALSTNFAVDHVASGVTARHANEDRQLQLDQLPDPNRGVEMSLSAAFFTVTGGAFVAELVEPLVWHHAANEATTVLLLAGGALVFDRFAYAGETWNKLSAGFDRLLSSDPSRESRVEAAHFLTAYVMGLPCAPFRPDARQILKDHARKTSTGNKSRSSARGYAVSDTDVDRYLIWLLAGVAAEAMLGDMLVESDPAMARSLLSSLGLKRDEERLVSACNAACRILTKYQVVHAKLADGMLSGMSAGQCVALLDRELS